MADELITKQELIDAKPDVKNLGEAANGNETGIVTPRYGAPYSTAPAAIQKIQIDGANAIQAFQNSGSSAIQSFQTNSGGALTSFQNNATAAITKVESTGGLISVPTLTALQAITSAYANQSAIVEATGAYYRWNATATPPAWVPTGRNFLTEAAADASTKATAAKNDANAFTTDALYQKSKVEIAFAKTTGDYRIASDGSIVAYGNMTTSVSLPISILTSNTITIEQLSTPVTQTLILAFYDSSNVFISGITAANSTVVQKTENIVVPSNAAFFRICYNRSLSTAKIFKSVNATIIFSEIASKEASSNASIKQAAKVKITPTYVAGGYILANDGTLTTWGGAVTSQPISLSGVSIIALENISARSIGNVAVAFYDSSNVFISSGLTLTGNQIVADTGLIFVPSNAASFRFCYNSLLTSAPNVYAVSAQYAYDLLKSETLSLLKPYAGKKILSLGDSYTWLNYYGASLVETTGCTQRARGQNGNVLRSFCNDSYTGSDGNLVSETFDAALLAQYDIVTIMGGTNDYGHGSATLGTISDTKDQNTIYGAVKFLIDKIQTLKPTIKIVFVTQPFRLQYSTEVSPGGYLPNYNGLTMQGIAKAIKECANLYGCPVYDFYSVGNWNELTIKKNAAGNFDDNIYTYDGLHPRAGSGNGAGLLGKGIGRFINSL